jgi:glycine betaine/choline ABC-type transport system substrate-binding protein
MTTKIRAVLAALLVLALAVTITACGGDDDENGGGAADTTASGGGEAIQSNPDNKGKSITVGSKNFTEQYVLGNIYAEALEAAGYDVKRELNLGSEVIAFKALKQGEIDAYPEYTGTALTSFYKVKVTDVPKDQQEAYEQVKKELEGDNISALPTTPFENTYRLGMTKEKAQEAGNPATISDLEGKSQDLTISGYPECRQRPDCLLGVQDTYGLKFKKFVASQEPYQALDTGSADVAFIFTTDANLVTDKYQVLDDDKKLFPPYNITFMIKSDKLQELGPDAQKVIEQVQEPLTEEVMQELNSRVDLDKKKPEVVAREYLQEAGFIAEG